ncbi:hypothetical protein Tco_0958691 [Tanacetum coccineum]
MGNDEDDVSEVSHVKTNETQTAKTQVDKIGQTSKKAGIGFKKIKACFVCKSTDHLIKDCNFHDKQSQEPKLKTMVNTCPRVDKPVWDNTKRLEFYDKHNMVAYLVKYESNEGFDEIIDFLTLSHIYYALTENPIIFVSLIEQFWETTILSTIEEGLQAISATIDGYEQLITKASLRRHLKLEDAEGISSLSNEEIFEQLAHMGSKKTSWDQFSSNIATTIICLATSRRFIQLLLNKQQRLLLPHTRTYPTPTLTSKLFSNMRRASKGYSGVGTPLFENETASMPHDSPLHAVYSLGSAEGSKQQHDLTILVNKLNDRIDGLEKDLQQTKKTYSTALTKLVLRVKKLEYKLKSSKARRKAKIILSDDEEITEDSSKQGRKISQIDEDLTISLVQDEGISWIPQEEEVHEKPCDETEVIVQEETPTKIIEEHGSGEERRSAKDKGKAIMKEPATPKKVKKGTQVQLSMDEELDRKMEEEERARFNAEQEAMRFVRKEEENQGGYKESYFKRMSYNDIRPIFERVWDHVNTFIPIGSEVEKWSSKPSKRETSKTVEEEKVEKEDVKLDLIMIEKKAVRIRRKTLARRKASVLKDEEESMTLEFLSVRYPIVNWEYQLHGRMEMKDVEAYKLTRADRTVSFHGGRFEMMFDPELSTDELWKKPKSWKVLRWKLYENSRVHSVFLTDTPMEINMLVEKKYPLKKEILEKMINLKLQAKEESTMAYGA